MELQDIRIRLTQNAMIDDRRLYASDVTAYLLFFWRPSATVHAHAKNNGLPLETMRRSAQRLVKYDWAITRPVKNGNIIIPWMPEEVEELIVQELSSVQEQVIYKGEWLMKCLLDLMVREPHRYDNPRPPWLVTGDGSGRLELDRLYPQAGLAFEFQGPQHYRVGPLTPTESDLHDQMSRDHIKAGLCNIRGLRLVHIKASDLNFYRMQEKLEGLVDLNPIRENRPLFRYVDNLCRSYANYAKRDDR